MSTQREFDEGVVRWLDLVLPGRSLERRVRRNAHLDALRGVGAGEGEGRAAAPRCPATIGEIAAWEAGTIRALGTHAHSLVGEYNARVDGLRARIAALGPPPEQRLAAASPRPLGGDQTAPLGASHPEAQARRRMRLDAHLWAAADADRAVSQAQLAEAVARRAAALAVARDTARQCHESSLALQHLYWAVRMRWSRRRHGAPPAVTISDVPLPDWVTAPEVLYGERDNDGSVA